MKYLKRKLTPVQKLVKTFSLLLLLVCATRRSEAGNELKNNRSEHLKLGMSQVPSIYASYMLHTFKDMGHIWDKYGTSMGHPNLCEMSYPEKALQFLGLIRIWLYSASQ